MLGSFAVAATQARARPTALTGLFADGLTTRARTVFLMPAIARIRLIQLVAMAALAPSSSLHESLPHEAPIMRDPHATLTEKNSN
jgi:hypothetical protein